MLRKCPNNGGECERVQTMGRVCLFPVQIQKVLEPVLHDVCLLRCCCCCCLADGPGCVFNILLVIQGSRELGFLFENDSIIMPNKLESGSGHVDNGVEAMITQYLFIEIIIIYDMGQTLCPPQCPVPCPFMCKAHVLGIETVASLIELPANCLPRPAPQHNWKVLSQHPKHFLRVLANYGTIAKCDKLKKHYKAWQSRNIHTYRL